MCSLPKGLKENSHPGGAPVTLADAKSWAKLHSTYTDQDGLVQEILDGAVSAVEGLLGGPITNGEFHWTLDGWPRSRRFRFPLRPLVAVDAVEYIADTDLTHTYVAVAASNYWVDLVRHAMSWNEGFDPPALKYSEISPVRITFRAGFGLSAALVPDAIRSAIRVLVSDHYHNPDGPTLRAWEAAQALLAPYGLPACAGTAENIA
jgi:uncharacterized phiE125 gp8 family phage protein